jgi:cytochrome b561
MLRDEVTEMNEKSDVQQNRAFAIRCYAWSRAIHWVTVALVSGLLVTALFDNIDPHGSGNKAFLWHSSLGLTVYILSITRVLLWFVYRPTASSAGNPDAVHRELRLAFYAVLIALPISGWWLASEEGVSSHVFAIPALPQWYQHEGAAHSGSTDSEVAREDAAREAPVVRYLTRLHASLGAALAIVIALHLLSAIRTRKQRTGGRKPEVLDVDKERPI